MGMLSLRSCQCKHPVPTMTSRLTFRLMIYPINTYAPSLIKSLGFGGYNANGLNSVGSVVSLIISISIAWNSDRTQERGFHITAGFCIGIAGLLWAALAPVNSSKWVVYGE